MMNYAAAFGYLQGRIEWIAIELKFLTAKIDADYLVKQLETAIKEATKQGETYDDNHDEYGNRK